MTGGQEEREQNSTERLRVAGRREATSQKVVSLGRGLEEGRTAISIFGSGGTERMSGFELREIGGKKGEKVKMNDSGKGEGDRKRGGKMRSSKGPTRGQSRLRTGYEKKNRRRRCGR